MDLTKSNLLAFLQILAEVSIRYVSAILHNHHHVVYSTHNNMHIYTYPCRIHIDAIIKTIEDFFKRYTSHFIERVECERELETKQNCNILTPTLIAISISFPFSWCCSTGGPLCWVLASSTASRHQRVWSPKLTDILSSPSYIILQSPTQSLEWHVWSSSSGNNCHAVRRSLSSGASVYDCTVGF